MFTPKMSLSCKNDAEWKPLLPSPPWYTMPSRELNGLLLWPMSVQLSSSIILSPLGPCSTTVHHNGMNGQNPGNHRVDRGSEAGGGSL